MARALMAMGDFETAYCIVAKGRQVVGAVTAQGGPDAGAVQPSAQTPRQAGPTTTTATQHKQELESELSEY